MAEVMQRVWLGEYPTAVACGLWVHPMFIHVAVKDLAPLTTTREADAVAEAVERRQMHHHDDVMPFTLHPALKGEHSVLILGVYHAEPLPAQGGILPAQPQQLARKA